MVLMGIRMPDVDGIAATREIPASVPKARILDPTTFQDDDYAWAASAGASGFCQATLPEQLIAAIHTIAAGELSRSRSVRRTVIGRVRGNRYWTPPRSGGYASHPARA